MKLLVITRMPIILGAPEMTEFSYSLLILCQRSRKSHSLSYKKFHLQKLVLFVLFSLQSHISKQERCPQTCHGLKISFISNRKKILSCKNSAIKHIQIFLQQESSTQFYENIFGQTHSSSQTDYRILQVFIICENIGRINTIIVVIQAWKNGRHSYCQI